MARFGSNSRNFLAISVVGIFALIAIGYAVWVYFPTASNQGYAPEQPIPFSHRLHAGVNKIDCKYCHVGVERSRHATIPSLNICMNCHRVVKTNSPYIQQITKAYKSGKPIEWIRVHELPDYVYFPHKRHIAAGLQCETCHGNVREMDRIYQFAPLNMGWCLNCHRGHTTPKDILEKYYPGVKHPEGPVATTDCNTCHH